MDRIGDIVLFLRTLDLGSISAAARSLDLSVAVASQRLKRLESDLGVRVLHRTTRHLHPTAEGQALAERGRRLVQDLETLGEDLRESAQQVTGTLRVTMPASFGQLYVTPLLPEFQRMHPKLRISAHLSDDLVDLVKDGYDLAIRIGALSDSGLVARRLVSNSRVLCASPGYLRIKGIPRTPADLAHHDGVLLMGRDGRHDTWTLVGPQRETTRVHMASRFESNFGEALREAVLAGQGISMHSRWHVAQDLRAGRLVAVLPDWHPPMTQISAVTPLRLQPPRVRHFIQFLVDRFSDPAPWENV